MGWQVYDGGSIASDVISVGISGQISGDMADLPAADKTFTSSGGSMTVQFVSDESLSAGGFEAAYRCGAPPCAPTDAGTGGVCVTCDHGSEPSGDQSTCVPCRLGFAGTGGVCIQCGPGSTPDASRMTCVETGGR
jgi:hypothetical protein